MPLLTTIAFACILGRLGAALFFMLKPSDPNKPRANRMARALALRVMFSILIFASILIGWKLGFIHPTGIPAGK